MKSRQPAILTEEQVIRKLETYCAYRERCEAEVRQKLYILGVEENKVDFYLHYLKKNNFLNEDRFVTAFARGKFAIKSWGRRRITQELQQKKIDPKKIRQSVDHIDEGLYFLRLQDLLEKKRKTIKETDTFKIKQKLLQYALQKGYETDLIYEALKSIEKQE